jgi:hypothetical protein
MVVQGLGRRLTPLPASLSLNNEASLNGDFNNHRLAHRIYVIIGLYPD